MSTSRSRTGGVVGVGDDDDAVVADILREVNGFVDAMDGGGGGGGGGGRGGFDFGGHDGGDDDVFGDDDDDVFGDGPGGAGAAGAPLFPPPAVRRGAGGGKKGGAPRGGEGSGAGGSFFGDLGAADDDYYGDVDYGDGSGGSGGSGRDVDARGGGDDGSGAVGRGGGFDVARASEDLYNRINVSYGDTGDGDGEGHNDDDDGNGDLGGNGNGDDSGNANDKGGRRDPAPSPSGSGGGSSVENLPPPPSSGKKHQPPLSRRWRFQQKQRAMLRQRVQGQRSGEGQEQGQGQEKGHGQEQSQGQEKAHARGQETGQSQGQETDRGRAQVPEEDGRRHGPAQKGRPIDRGEGAAPLTPKRPRSANSAEGRAERSAEVPGRPRGEGRDDPRSLAPAGASAVVAAAAASSAAGRRRGPGENDAASLLPSPSRPRDRALPSLSKFSPRRREDDGPQPTLSLSPPRRREEGGPQGGPRLMSSLSPVRRQGDEGPRPTSALSPPRRQGGGGSGPTSSPSPPRRNAFAAVRPRSQRSSHRSPQRSSHRSPQRSSRRGSLACAERRRASLLLKVAPHPEGDDRDRADADGYGPLLFPVASGAGQEEDGSGDGEGTEEAQTESRGEGGEVILVNPHAFDADREDDGDGGDDGDDGGGAGGTGRPGARARAGRRVAGRVTVETARLVAEVADGFIGRRRSRERFPLTSRQRLPLDVYRKVDCQVWILHSSAPVAQVVSIPPLNRFGSLPSRSLKYLHCNTTSHPAPQSQISSEDWARKYRFDDVIWPPRPRGKSPKPSGDPGRDRPNDGADDRMAATAAAVVGDVLRGHDAATTREGDGRISRGAVVCAVGGTGSGKTRTVFGAAVAALASSSTRGADGEESADPAGDEGRDLGLVGEVVRELLSSAKAGDPPLACYLSIVEISDDDVLRDVLAFSERDLDERGATSYLRVRHLDKRGAVVLNLARDPVTSMDRLRRVLLDAFGCKPLRRIWNAEGGHGHFLVTVAASISGEEVARIQLLDTASPDRQHDAGAKRTSSIRKSLSALRGVLRGVITQHAAHQQDAPPSFASPIPYRESALTQLLQRSLEGPGASISADGRDVSLEPPRIVVIGTVCPSSRRYNQTLATMDFVTRLLARPGDTARSPFDSMVPAARKSASGEQDTEEQSRRQSSIASTSLRSITSDPRQRLAKLLHTAPPLGKGASNGRDGDRSAARGRGEATPAKDTPAKSSSVLSEDPVAASKRFRDSYVNVFDQLTELMSADDGDVDRNSFGEGIVQSLTPFKGGDGRGGPTATRFDGNSSVDSLSQGMTPSPFRPQGSRAVARRPNANDGESTIASSEELAPSPFRSPFRDGRLSSREVEERERKEREEKRRLHDLLHGVGRPKEDGVWNGDRHGPFDAVRDVRPPSTMNDFLRHRPTEPDSENSSVLSSDWNGSHHGRDRQQRDHSGPTSDFHQHQPTEPNSNNSFVLSRDLNGSHHGHDRRQREIDSPYDKERFDTLMTKPGQLSNNAEQNHFVRRDFESSTVELESSEDLHEGHSLGKGNDQVDDLNRGGNFNRGEDVGFQPVQEEKQDDGRPREDYHSIDPSYSHSPTDAKPALQEEIKVDEHCWPEASDVRQNASVSGNQNDSFGSHRHRTTGSNQGLRSHRDDSKTNPGDSHGGSTVQVPPPSSVPGKFDDQSPPPSQAPRSIEHHGKLDDQRGSMKSSEGPPVTLFHENRVDETNGITFGRQGKQVGEHQPPHQSHNGDDTRDASWNYNLAHNPQRNQSEANCGQSSLPDGGDRWEEDLDAWHRQRQARSHVQVEETEPRQQVDSTENNSSSKFDEQEPASKTCHPSTAAKENRLDKKVELHQEGRYPSHNGDLSSGKANSTNELDRNSKVAPLSRLRSLDSMDSEPLVSSKGHAHFFDDSPNKQSNPTPPLNSVDVPTNTRDSPTFAMFESFKLDIDALVTDLTSPRALEGADATEQIPKVPESASQSAEGHVEQDLRTGRDGDTSIEVKREDSRSSIIESEIASLKAKVNSLSEEKATSEAFLRKMHSIMNENDGIPPRDAPSPVPCTYESVEDAVREKQSVLLTIRSQLELSETERTQLLRELEQAGSKVTELSEAVDRAEKDLAESQGTTTNLDCELTRLKERLEDLRLKNEASSIFFSQLDDALGISHDATLTCDLSRCRLRLGSIEDLKSQLQEGSRKLDESLQREHKANSTASELEHQLILLQDSSSGMEAKRLQTEKLAEEAISANETLTNDIADLRGKLLAKENEYESLLASHQSSLVQYENVKSLVSARDSDVSALKVSFEACREEKAQLEQQLTSIRMKTVDAMKKRIEELKSDYDRRFQDFKTRYIKERQEGDESRLQFDLSKKETENAHLRNRIEQIEKSSSLKLQNAEERLRQVAEELDSSKDEASNQKEENMAMKEELDHLRGLMDIAEESISELNCLKEENKKLNDTIRSKNGNGSRSSTEDEPFEIRSGLANDDENSRFMHERISALMRENEQNNISMRTLQSENVVLKSSIEECNSTIHLMHSEMGDLKMFATTGVSKLRTREKILRHEMRRDKDAVSKLEKKLENANHLIHSLHCNRFYDAQGAGSETSPSMPPSSTNILNTPQERYVPQERHVTRSNGYRDAKTPPTISWHERRFVAELSTEKELRFKAEEIAAGVLANSKAALEERDTEISKLRAQLNGLLSDRHNNGRR
ncbi:hypothetical protein ACHAWF_017243 [Thalassiosira exigua]